MVGRVTLDRVARKSFSENLLWGDDIWVPTWVIRSQPWVMISWWHTWGRRNSRYKKSEAGNEFAVFEEYRIPVCWNLRKEVENDRKVQAGSSSCITYLVMASSILSAWKLIRGFYAENSAICFFFFLIPWLLLEQWIVGGYE